MLCKFCCKIISRNKKCSHHKGQSYEASCGAMATILNLIDKQNFAL
ncbi:MAG: hypothetical protein MR878_05780 [Campylobacter sp.]|nr:hypothetical protein [Campylobacter sp.]